MNNVLKYPIGTPCIVCGRPRKRDKRSGKAERWSAGRCISCYNITRPDRYTCSLCGRQRRDRADKFKLGLCHECYNQVHKNPHRVCPQCGGPKHEISDICLRCHIDKNRIYNIGYKCPNCGKERKSKKDRFRRGVCQSCYRYYKRHGVHKTWKQRDYEFYPIGSVCIYCGVMRNSTKELWVKGCCMSCYREHHRRNVYHNFTMATELFERGVSVEDQMIDYLFGDE